MRSRAWLAAVTVVAGWTAAAHGDNAPDPLDRLIARLGSGAYGDREAATRELDALGPDALAALRRAAESAEPETRRRAAELVGRIGDRLTTARILAPTAVAFNYENKPVIEAVVDFNNRTGAGITIDNPGRYHGRTITAATPGPVPFWDAVELFCRKADVHEWDGFSRLSGQPDAPQAGSGVIVPIQGQVIFRRAGGFRTVNPTPAGIVLRDGPGAALAACRSGAVRMRVAPIGTAIDGVSSAGPDEVILPLQLSAEPKLHWQGAVDMRIDRAIDDRGRALICTPAVRDLPSDDEELIFINAVGGMLMSNAPRRGGPVGVRVQRGERSGTRLAELSGSVAAQVRVAEPLAMAEAPLKAAGQTMRGSFGVTLKVTAATRSDNGDVKIGVEIHMPADVQLQGAGEAVQMAGQLQIMPGGGAMRRMRPGSEPPSLPAGTTEFQGLALEDGKGRRFAATRGAMEMSQFAQDGVAFKFTATFKPADAEQQPTRLVFTATRPATIEIPFRAKDIPLQ
jgi:hypothetical protein